jgi:hypothetical protein
MTAATEAGRATAGAAVVRPITEVFAWAAEKRMARSPRYSLLARTVAADDSLGAPLAGSDLDWGRPAVLFAAVQLLLTESPDEPLARWYPTLGGDLMPGPAMAAAFTDLVRRRGDELAALCAGQVPRTNDPAVAALIRPAAGFAARVHAAGRPLWLVELGAAAGLALPMDRYTCRYGPATDPYVMSCAITGPKPTGVDTPLRVAGRVGVDLDPIRPGDSDGIRWLRAGVWPDDPTELRRLDHALATTAAAGVRWVAGDILDVLPSVLAEAPVDCLPVVYSASVLCCLAGRDRLPGIFAAAGRDSVWITAEVPAAGLALVSDDPSPFGAGPKALTVARFGAGRLTAVDVLGGVDPFGTALGWRPRSLRTREVVQV